VSSAYTALGTALILNSILVKPLYTIRLSADPMPVMEDRMYCEMQLLPFELLPCQIELRTSKTSSGVSSWTYWRKLVDMEG
jgi:hypothetical protein